MQKVLKERGMIFSKAFFPLAGQHKVVDGRLIKGQNPNSVTKAVSLYMVIGPIIDEENELFGHAPF